jgi:hypothetical protein
MTDYYRHRGTIGIIYDNDSENNRRCWTKVNDVIKAATNGECELMPSWRTEGDETTFTVKTSERPVSAVNADLMTTAVKKKLGKRYDTRHGYASTGKTDSPFATAERDTLFIVYKGLPVLPRSPLQSTLILGGAVTVVILLLYLFVIDPLRALL